MLKLVNITKNYKTGDTVVPALRGVNIEFGENEFVAVLGQSGCGKTTLLNIIGGLDQYTGGDLIINGVSTKKYKSSDWDLYRNRSIGFVFQSYQLIPHQSVLSNVELTMTLSGISREERKKRAIEALKAVGLGDQLNKKPNQMSGGQMQRTAIARALVNNPDIILADDPTGALDSVTSVQIMEILKEVAKDRLVIMVTHNPELAETYATRIVRLVDGVVTEDRAVSEEEEKKEPGIVEVVGTDPMAEALPEKKKAATEKKAEKTKAKKKTSMSFFTALSLSLKNLMTKKGRTFLTAFAGAIGIIGIAMILSLSTGVQNYIDSVESDTLANYPLQIYRETVDFAEMMESMMPTSEETSDEDGEDKEITEITSNNMMTNMITSIANDKTENDMAAAKEFIDSNEELQALVQSVEYGYSTPLYVYRTDGLLSGEEGLMQVNPATVMDNMGMTGSTSSSMLSLMSGEYDVWASLPKNRDMTEQMYELVDGRYPENYDEVVVAVSEDGKIGDYTLYALGMLDQVELKDLMTDVMSGKELEKKETLTYSFEELYALEFTAIPSTAYYEKKDNGTYEDVSEDEERLLKILSDEGIKLKIVGVVSVTQNASSNVSVYGGVLYQAALIDELIDRVNESEIVKAQKEDPDTDVFTGIAFPTDDEEEEKALTMEDLENYLSGLSEEEQATSQAMITAMLQQGMSEEEVLSQFSAFMTTTTDATYEGNLSLLGVSDPEDPAEIDIYPVDFEAKEKIVDILNAYSSSLDEGEELKYTDYVGLIMSSVTTIINVITYILIGFVGISLVVSSIMIGIITYISVLERTREIGILRAIGASKKDISRVFNAETIIIGFISGMIGIAVPYGVSVFVNALVEGHFGVENIMYLAPQAAVILVLISMLLTLIGGLIPSKLAAKKDPVEALRTE